MIDLTQAKLSGAIYRINDPVPNLANELFIESFPIQGYCILYRGQYEHVIIHMSQLENLIATLQQIKGGDRNVNENNNDPSDRSASDSISGVE